MIGTSAPNFWFISSVIIGFRSLAPVAILYCLSLPLHSLRLPPLLQWYLALEALFFLFVYLPLARASQRPAVHPPLHTRDERRALFVQCQRAMPDPEAYLRRWFRDAPVSEIRRENVKQFFRWGFLNTDVIDEGHDEEMDEYVDGVEKSLGRPIEPGHGAARPLLLTLDPVGMQHRPLVWYLIVFGCDMLTHMRLSYLGFRFYKSSLDWHDSVIPPRPQNFWTTTQSSSKTLSYWYRPHRSSTKRPIVFMHGIGIGLLTYVPFLEQINRFTRANDDVGIIAIELLPISFRLTHAALPKLELCREIYAILVQHGFESFVLVSHSYGSVVSTHMLKDAQIAPMISSAIFIDPVCFLLHQPDVAYNFTYRQPQTANEHQLWYFASMDMGVSHTLARSFFWSENILWKEDLGGRRLSVFLAGKDIIVNTKEVARYLSSRPREHLTTEASSGGPVVIGDRQGGSVSHVRTVSGSSSRSAMSVGSALSATSSSGQRKRKQHRLDRSHDYDWIDKEGVWQSQDGGVKVFWNSELDHAQVFDSTLRLRVLAGEVLDHCKTNKSAR